MTTALTNSPADIVRQLLVDMGEAADNTAFAGVIPALPDNCIAVFSGTDVIDARSMRATLMQHYGIQFRVRNMNFNAGVQQVQELQRWMAEDVLNEVVSGGALPLTGSYKVYNFAKIGPVLRLGMNVPNDKRLQFTVNALCVIKSL